MNRRTFVAAGAGWALSAQTQTPVIDTHIHLFDPSRPEGVPWPPPTNKMIYKTTLPSTFREVTRGLGVVGAIKVEASPWLEDNQWVLDVAAKDSIIVGVVGNLEPEKPDFRKNLERFAKNPLFRGIRNGYLWNRDVRQSLQRPEFIRGLKDLAAANLSLDTANPSVNLLEDVLRISDAIPELRVIIDHLPGLYPPTAPAERARYDAALNELKQRSNVFAKLSAVLRMQDGKRVSLKLADHKNRLDLLYEAFGPDRVLFGSDWPNSEPSAPYTAVLEIVREYFSGKSREAAEKYFWRNSAKAYQWVRRDESQPDPGAQSRRA